MHHQQKHNPFTTPAGLPKQYSTAQVLNARVRHTSSSGGSGVGRSSIGGVYDAAADSLAAATAALLQGPAARRGSDGNHQGQQQQQQQQQHASVTVSAATASMPPCLDLGSLALTASPAGCGAAAGSQVVVLLTNGSSNGAYPLAACSSVISVPDASGYGTAVAAADSCNGSSCLQALVTEKVEGLLEGTRSVPFELVLSPRSKFLIASTAPRGSSAGGGDGSTSAAAAAAAQPMAIDVASPLGQHLLQLLMETGRVSENGTQGASGIPTTALTLSLAQWQWLQQQYQQQQQREGEEEQGAMQVRTSPPPQPPQPAAAAVPEAPVAAACAATAEMAFGLPSIQSSSVVDAVAQLLSGSDCSTSESAFTTPAAAVAAVAAACEAAVPAALAAASGGSSAAASPGRARPESSGPASPEQQQQQLVVTAFARSSDGGRDSSNASGSADDSQASPQQQQQQQAADGGDLAAELAALLQSAGSMSPEEKADAVARTFAKTISRLNM
jgi:hypothetical protein